jgi:hypothetical protein
VLRPAKTRSQIAVHSGQCPQPLALSLEQPRETQPEEARSTDFEQVAASDPIAQAFGAAKDPEHVAAILTSIEHAPQGLWRAFIQITATATRAPSLYF